MCIVASRINWVSMRTHRDEINSCSVIARNNSERYQYVEITFWQCLFLILSGWPEGEWNNMMSQIPSTSQQISFQIGISELKEIGRNLVHTALTLSKRDEDTRSRVIDRWSPAPNWLRPLSTLWSPAPFWLRPLSSLYSRPLALLYQSIRLCKTSYR